MSNLKTLKDTIFELCYKIKKLLYFLVIVLWFVGAIAVPYGFPWIVVGILAMHLCEFPIGWYVGRKAGESIPYILVMHFTFGFTWWIPLSFAFNNDKDY